MEIEGTLIKDSEIIGVGPLMATSGTGQIDATIYNSKKFSYLVHLKQHSINIETNFLKIGFKGDEIRDEVKEARETYKKFVENYQEVKKQIAAMIDETTNPIYKDF
jgi:hypothetical protein